MLVVLNRAAGVGSGKQGAIGGGGLRQLDLLLRQIRRSSSVLLLLEGWIQISGKDNAHPATSSEEDQLKEGNKPQGE